MRNLIKRLQDFIDEYWTIIALVVIVFICLRSCFDGRETVTIKVPVKVMVPVPVYKHKFDTIEVKDKDITRIILDSTYYDKYISLKDSIIKDSMVRDAFMIREYNTYFKDSIIDIDSYHKVRGKLLASSVSYETKPREVELDTSLTISVPVIKERRKFLSAGIETGANLENPFGELPVIKTNVGFMTKNKIYSISYDTEKRTWVGVHFMF